MSRDLALSNIRRRTHGLTILAALVLCAAAWGVRPAVSLAHEVRPASLQITASAPGTYEAIWKQPTVGDMAIHLAPRLSSGALNGAPTSQTAEPGRLIKRWTIVNGAPLEGQTLTIEGLPLSVTDVLVRIAPASGETINTVLRPADPSMTISLRGPAGLAIPAYLRLGIEHILTGPDHLLFVLGLLLIVGTNWAIVKTVTAFTVSHSLTLALAALGLVHVQPALIEALIALSIVFVAYELVPRPSAAANLSLTRRKPWLVAFIFGLFHGLAFAGTLSAVGLPKGAVPQALLLFNLGVEIGQLAFIAAAIIVILALRQIKPRLPAAYGTLERYGPAYGIGALAAYWFIERSIAAFA